MTTCKYYYLLTDIYLDCYSTQINCFNNISATRFVYLFVLCILTAIIKKKKTNRTFKITQKNLMKENKMKKIIKVACHTIRLRTFIFLFVITKIIYYICADLQLHLSDQLIKITP